MKKNLLSIVFFIFLFSCQQKKYEYLHLSGPTQGSTYSITYENSNSKNYSAEIDSVLHTIDNSLSNYNPASIISRININDTVVKLDSYLKEVINLSFEINKASHGAFDITVGPIVKAWGFGPDNAMKHGNVKIDSLLLLVGMDKLSFTCDKLKKKNSKMIIDVNAIAQGYSVDIVCRFFDSMNIKNYLVEIGGEVRAKGKNANGEIWKIGVDKPEEGNNQPGESISAIIELNNKSVSTSGNYRKFYTENGVKYSHTIDPHTGLPARNNLLSATIMSNDCANADAYATACMVMGYEKSKTFLQTHTELEAVLIYNNEKGEYCEYLTKGIKDLLKK